jgi:Pentapeptide repeats (8 copies)
VELLSEYALFLVAAVIALGFIWFCGWDARRRLKKFNIRNPKDRADVEDGFRKTTAQILGAAAVVIVFAYTFTKDNLTFEQARSQSAASTYAEGTKLLKEKDATVRAAGIYLIEQVGALDQQYRDPISRTLVAFVHQQTPRSRLLLPQYVEPDVKAAIQVLGRTAPISDHDKFAMNLDATNLAAADFGWLMGFKERRLQGADLRHANFKHADLSGARLSGAEMNEWAAYGPKFGPAVYQRASWAWEKYRYVVEFDCANLKDTQLDGTGLTGALFGRANMEATNLDRANLSRADFSSARNLEEINFGDACADDSPKYPEGFECNLRKCGDHSSHAPYVCRFTKPPETDRDAKIAKSCLVD